MIKIQDLINTKWYELSTEANYALEYVVDEFKPEDIVSKDILKEVIEMTVSDWFIYSPNAYRYLSSHTCGEFDEAIDAGNKTVTDIARYYLRKELLENVDEMEDK